MLTSSKSNTDNESLAWNVTAGSNYFIRVTGPNGWTNNYALTIDQPVAVGNDIFDVSFVPDSLADLFLNDRVNLSFS